jgi:hypothetical protein
MTVIQERLVYTKLDIYVFYFYACERRTVIMCRFISNQTKNTKIPNYKQIAYSSLKYINLTEMLFKRKFLSYL